jgi:Uma2 family endonuclease
VKTAQGDYLYPDLLITCDEHDLQDPLVKRSPLLVIEVLLPLTEGYDRGEKFDAYAAASSLAEYVQVSARDRRVEVLTRQEGHWERTTYLPPAQIPFAPIDLSVSFDLVYAGVQWGPRLLAPEDRGEARQ